MFPSKAGSNKAEFASPGTPWLCLLVSPAIGFRYYVMCSLSNLNSSLNVLPRLSCAAKCTNSVYDGKKGKGISNSNMHTVSDGSVSGNYLKSRNLCSGTKITGWPVPKIVLTLV